MDDSAKSLVDKTFVVLDEVNADMRRVDFNCEQALQRIDASIEMIDAHLNAGGENESEYLQTRQRLVALRQELPCASDRLAAQSDSGSSILELESEISGNTNAPTSGDQSAVGTETGIDNRAVAGDGAIINPIVGSSIGASGTVGGGLAAAGGSVGGAGGGLAGTGSVGGGSFGGFASLGALGAAMAASSSSDNNSPGTIVSPSTF
jgi:hypothetical protein